MRQSRSLMGIIGVAFFAACGSSTVPDSRGNNNPESMQ
jgi:hypothetical protein